MAVSVIEFEKALAALSESLAALDQAKDPVLYRLFRDATIQRFEFSVELAWKTSRKVMATSTVLPRQVVREMAQAGLIDDPDAWFGFIDARNRTSHTYDEKVAEEVLIAVHKFSKSATALLKKLRAS